VETSNRPKILVTNDDGLAAPGLCALFEELAPLARLRAALPLEEMSGVGHAVTLHRTLQSRPVEIPRTEAAFAGEGTPVDAVKLALTTVWRDFRFDLVVSGINRGPNVGVNVLYSGTVAAGLEALVAGIPAVAVSLDVGEGREYAQAARVAARIVRRLLGRLDGERARGLPPFLINVNVPNRPGPFPWRLTRQGRSGFAEYYLPAEEGGAGEAGPPSPKSRRTGDRWRIGGEMVLREDSPEYDAVALSQGCVSITPLGLDLTLRGAEGEPSRWGFLLEEADGAG